jgi:hypothetical protein
MGKGGEKERKGKERKGKERERREMGQRSSHATADQEQFAYAFMYPACGIGVDQRKRYNPDTAWLG